MVSSTWHHSVQLLGTSSCPSNTAYCYTDHSEPGLFVCVETNTQRPSSFYTDRTLCTQPQGSPAEASWLILMYVYLVYPLWVMSSLKRCLMAVWLAYRHCQLTVQWIAETTVHMAVHGHRQLLWARPARALYKYSFSSVSYVMLALSLYR